ncbi:MAG: HRDC domain-containing protein [Thermoplasmatota archaeon]
MKVEAIGDQELLEWVVEKDFEDTVSRIILNCAMFFEKGIGRKRMAMLLKGMDPDFVISRSQGAKDFHGRLSLLDMDQITDFIESLMRLGLLSLDDTDFPRISITDKGRKALRGSKTIPAMIPWPLPATEVPFPVDGELFGLLKAERNLTASEEDLPPYCIASNISLVEMVNLGVTDLRSMLDVKGIGKIRCERYGERFLRVIWEHTSSSA